VLELELSGGRAAGLDFGPMGWDWLVSFAEPRLTLELGSKTASEL
jgi:hypothetical protein